MSAAACKTILCSHDADASIKVYLISSGQPQLLQIAGTKAAWELEATRSVTHLLVAQGFTITFSHAHDLIEAMEVVEDHMAEQSQQDAPAFLANAAQAIRAALEAMHEAVTGETLDYD